MDVASLLRQTLQPDAAGIRAAQEQLEAAANTNFLGYMQMLSAELANDGQDAPVRLSAALAFKNGIAVPSRDPNAQAPLTQRWLGLPEGETQKMKGNCLTALGSASVQVGSGAAQCIAAIAHIEFPVNKGSDMLQALLASAQNMENVKLRVHTLQAIGYICDGMAPEVIAHRSNDILTAVVQGARKEEANVEIQAAALQALYNSLEFISDNFDREGERNYIMQVLCEATQNEQARVQSLAFQNLVRIMSLYYDQMRFYMERALFGLTLNGMRSDYEQVALQAIEFWSTTCEEEIDRTWQAQEAAEFGEAPEQMSHNFSRTALPEVAPVLLNTLTMQEEDASEDDWNRAMSAATCLQLFAQAIGDDITSVVLPFVEQNIRAENWHQREAAVMAFGSIMDGPDPRSLGPLVNQIISTLINMLGSDPSTEVRDTVAWTISKITETVLEHVTPDEHMDPLVAALCTTLTSDNEPRVITNSCAALGNIANFFAGNEAPATHNLSRYFTPVLGAILPITQRSTNEGNCRTAAFQTIAMFIAASADDTLPAVNGMVQEMINRQRQLFSVHNQLVSMEDRDNWNDMQVHICVVLQAALSRAPAVVQAHADDVMTNVLQLMQTSKTAGIVEDAFATVGALANATEQQFIKYMDAFVPFLEAAFASVDDWQMAQAGVFVVSDISRALGSALEPYTASIVRQLLTILGNPLILRTVKPHAITAIGDVATAIGPAFATYLDATMNILSQAGSGVSEQAQPADQEFFASMREGIIDAFAGILAGLRGGDPQPFQQYVVGIMQFIHQFYVDPSHTKESLSSSLGLIGDMGETFGTAAKEPLSQDFVQEMIREGRDKRMSKSLRNNAAYAQQVVSRLI